MLAGLCHSGAWGCFDRIGCLPEGVLSVMAQQLSAVLAAQRGGAWRGAWIDGKAFALQPTTAFFVNTVSAHTGTVPASLRAHCRVLALPEPDAVAMAAARLFQARFDRARQIAARLQCLYQLASDVLSKDAPYGFGVRSINAVVDKIIATRDAALGAGVDTGAVSDEMQLAAEVNSPHTYPGCHIEWRRRSGACKARQASMDIAIPHPALHLFHPSLRCCFLRPPTELSCL